METLDRLIKNGNQPKRSFYVAFGHDEEVSGNQGAGKISKELSNMVNDKYEKIGKKKHAFQKQPIERFWVRFLLTSSIGQLSILKSINYLI